MHGDITGYDWDATSNLAEIDYPGSGGVVNRGFDDAGRLQSTSDWLGNTTTFDYDDNGNWTKTVFPTGTTNTDEFTYDTANRMTGVTWKQGSTVLGTEDYTRPLKGLVEDITATGGAGAGTKAHGYDARDRLVTADTDTYVYDLAGSVTERSDGTLQVFDPAQRLCWTSPTASTGDCATPTADATVFDYDEKGNRVSSTPPGGHISAYRYDQANRLVEAAIPPWDDKCVDLGAIPGVGENPSCVTSREERTHRRSCGTSQREPTLSCNCCDGGRRRCRLRRRRPGVSRSSRGRRYGCSQGLGCGGRRPSQQSVVGGSVRSVGVRSNFWVGVQCVLRRWLLHGCGIRVRCCCKLDCSEAGFKRCLQLYGQVYSRSSGVNRDMPGKYTRNDRQR